jgi:hypothetical protein
MPRLSLYRPEKGNDFRFLDRVINEEFQVGGTDVFIHKYLGPVNPEEGTSSPAMPMNANSTPELGIQDLLLLENRDRHYASDVYVLRGIYDMVDIDFNLSQFGLFLQNDTVMVMFHLRTCFDTLGRKIMAGDVIELPHQKDEYALDENSLVALKRFYVVQDVTRPAKGYSQTWYPHLLRAKCVPLVDSQEFKEILDGDSGAGDGSTLRDLLSQYQKEIDINNQVIAQAEADAGSSGYDTKHLYTLPIREDGLVDVADASITDIDASADNAGFDASIVLQSPNKNIYVGYLTGDGIPPNGAPYGFGITFPSGPVKNQFFLRTDYMPNRLYRFDGKRWIKYEDNVRMTLNNLGNEETSSGTFAGKQVKKTQKSGFINNVNTSTIAGEVVQERQALSKVLKPRADN